MKVAIHTLGCKVNTYESEYIIKSFLDSGFEIISFSSDEKADIYVINTCTVTNISDQKSRKMIRTAKNKNSNAIVVAMGCFCQVNKNFNDIKNDADIIVGNDKKSDIVNLVLDYIKNKKQIIRINDINNSSFDDMNLSTLKTRTRALIKIEDGCENFCSYCIIPYARGKVRSKDINEVVKEASNLANMGYKEIVLTGIHTGHYGADKAYDFSDLLIRLNEIKDLEVIRISSIEITELNDKFLETLKKCNKIANHMHIPLQAGSDRILKLMNRKYDKKYFYDKIEKIRRIRPNISITTDVIVGFPGETNDEFNETINFVKKINFAKGHVFPYSNRKGTKASSMDGQLTNDEKHKRSKLLIEEFKILEEQYCKEFIGKTLSVIPENYSNGVLKGHSNNYLLVTFEGCDNLIGNIVNVKINQYQDNKLIGELTK